MSWQRWRRRAEWIQPNPYSVGISNTPHSSSVFNMPVIFPTLAVFPTLRWHFQHSSGDFNTSAMFITLRCHIQCTSGGSNTPIRFPTLRRHFQHSSGTQTFCGHSKYFGGISNTPVAFSTLQRRFQHFGAICNSAERF